MGHRLKDNDNAKKIGAEYIMQMKNPFTLNNLSFIKLFTKSTYDPGFSFLVKNGPVVDRILGPNQARTSIKVIIFNQELKKYVKDKQNKPDWQQLEKELTAKYGQIGEEILWNTQSKYALSVKDWQMAHDVARKLINKYGEFVTAGELNDYAWRLFEQVHDRNMLTDALFWSKRSIDETNEPKFMDTYAHLLQKLGRTGEAISWQERAVKALPNDPDLTNALEKMKKGEPTWTN
jgi:tetratricopeptide (TPR) repeat protein